MSKIEDYLKEKNLTDEKWIWKKTAAQIIGKNEKTLERKAAAGVLKQADQDGKTLYSVESLIEYENSLESKVLKPAVESDTERQTPTSLALEKTASGDLLQAFGTVFEQINQKLEARTRSALSEVSGKLFLDALEAAEHSGISKTHLKRLIDEAENRGELKRYSGTRGKAVYKCDDLQRLIDGIEPTSRPHRQPPTQTDRQKKK